jgi:hypothetical protein
MGSLTELYDHVTNKFAGKPAKRLRRKEEFDPKMGSNRRWPEASKHRLTPMQVQTQQTKHRANALITIRCRLCGHEETAILKQARLQMLAHYRAQHRDWMNQQDLKRWQYLIRGTMGDELEVGAPTPAGPPPEQQVTSRKLTRVAADAPPTIKEGGTRMTANDMIEQHPDVMRQVAELGKAQAFRMHPEWEQLLMGHGESRQAIYDAINTLRFGSKYERKKNNRKLKKLRLLNNEPEQAPPVPVREPRFINYCPNCAYDLRPHNAAVNI